jgi:hypothetical protein
MGFVLYEPRKRLAAELASSSGLALNTLSSYAKRPLGRDGLVLRFGGLSCESIVRGARELCRAGARTRPT